jgi:hypothetical protein
VSLVFRRASFISHRASARLSSLKGILQTWFSLLKTAISRLGLFGTLNIIPATVKVEGTPEK